MTTEEGRTLVIAAMVLLREATSNSMNPEHRDSWKVDRDYVVEGLKELAKS